jgi:hypothetical protein
MSYSTRYKLEPILHKPLNDPLREVLGEPEPDFVSVLMNSSSDLDGFNPFDEECSWYAHEDDMKMLSKQFPAYVFLLRGWGADRDDIWVKHFFQGKIHVAKAKITFKTPPPDFWA